MDPALWLLLRLRIRGWLRRAGRSLGTVKGALLAALGLLLFAPQILPVFLMPRLSHIFPGHLERVRRFGTLDLCAYCLLTLLFSSGERAIYFAPAEVNFLFPGPFRRRQLLAYKLAGQLMGVAIMAVFMTAVLSPQAARVEAGFVGLFLVLVFLHLFAVAVALVMSTVGALAYNRSRRLAIAALAALIVAALLQEGREALLLEPWDVLARVERSGAVQAVLSPLRWFLAAFTAERLWPDLLEWAALGLAVDAALLAFVFALDAHFLETAAASSARLYARIERMRRGGVGPAPRASSRKRAGLPMWPCWGGAGPIAWRQLTTARRDYPRMLAVLVVLGMPLLLALIVGRQDPDTGSRVIVVFEGIVVGLTFFLTTMLPFDFRADVERMAELKALPIRASRLAIGQLLAPVVLLTALQWTALGGLALWAGAAGDFFWAIAACALPYNALLFGVENLWCLLFPTRWAPAAGFDLQATGRAVVLIFAKVAILALSAGLAAGVGAVAFFLSGFRWMPALGAAWVVLAACAAGLVPFLALAFDRFDVARDTPV